MKKLIPAIIWAIIIAYLSFSCDKEYKQQDVPRGTLDTIYGLITVNNPYLQKFTMLGAKSYNTYYRIEIAQTNTKFKAYVDTAFWSETPNIYVTDFKRF